VLIACAAGLAHADPQAADRAADEATSLADKGQFAPAAMKFREAYRADPRPELMCNVGVAYYKAKDLTRAQRYLEQCVQIGASADAAFIANVKQVLQTLDASLHAGEFTPVSFLIEPENATIAAVGNEPFDEPILGSRVVWFPYGAWTVTIHAEGFADQKLAIDAHAHDTISKSVRLAPAVAAPPPAPIIVTKTPVPAHSHAAPIAASVITGVIGAASLAFIGISRLQASNANTAMLYPDYQSKADSAKTWQKVAIGTAIAAGIGAGVSAYLWVHALRVDVEPHGATVAIGGSF
jgi:tetratricopeptide (TPR) repeat protein